MKTVTLSASLLLTTMFINAQDLASKIVGNYKQTSVALNFGSPIIPKSPATYEIVKREDNLIDLKSHHQNSNNYTRSANNGSKRQLHTFL